jgi:hypothetical protein
VQFLSTLFLRPPSPTGEGQLRLVQDSTPKTRRAARLASLPTQPQFAD